MVGEEVETMADVTPDSAQTRETLERVSKGDAAALEALLRRFRPELLAFVELHLDPCLRARIDPSDVAQEAQLEAVRRMDDFLARRPMPFRLWLRKNAYRRLLSLRRYHVGRRRRSVRREVAMPDRSSALLARPLLARGPSPSQPRPASWSSGSARRWRSCRSGTARSC